MNRVEEEQVRLDAGFAESLKRPPHGELVGPGDPQGVDLGGRREPDGDAPRAPPDPPVERLADLRRQPLGVVEAEDLGRRIENHRAGIDGSSEASSPHLVQTGDRPVSVGTGASLLLEEPREPTSLFLEGGSAETRPPPVPGGQFSLFSAMRAALPLRSRR
jgi:hypothetical protein